MLFVGASIVPKSNPSIGIIKEIEKSENTTDKKLNRLFKIISPK